MAARNDFSSRLVEVQCTMDGVAADGAEGNCVQEVKEIERVGAEARAAICAAINARVLSRTPYQGYQQEPGGRTWIYR